MSLLILVAEDDPGVRMTIDGYLASFGYSVVIAEDGKQALSMIQKYHPHLLISDINMPNLNGYDLVREIRKFPELRLLPVIFLTDYNEVADRVQGYQVGCDAYLAKPFESEELEAIVRNLLERSQIFHTELSVAKIKYQDNIETEKVISPEQLEKRQLSIALTEKEEQVLALVLQGFSNMNIGEQLHLSHRTIEKYVSRLLRKTQTKNRIELITFSLKNNLS